MSLKSLIDDSIIKERNVKVGEDLPIPSIEEVEIIEDSGVQQPMLIDSLQIRLVPRKCSKITIEM